MYALPNNYYLNNFTFKFEMDGSYLGDRVDYMPLHFVQFAKSAPQLETLEIDLA